MSPGPSDVAAEARSPVPWSPTDRPDPPDVPPPTRSSTTRPPPARSTGRRDQASQDDEPQGQATRNQATWDQGTLQVSRDRAVPDGFIALFDAECTRTVRFAALLGADDPEDIAQEAFYKLLASWDRINSANPVPYLRRIVLNATRARNRHLRIARLRRPAADPPAASAEERALDATERRSVVHALRYLSPRQREAIVLRYWLDLPHDQIARAMGVSHGTVKSQISRGVRKLEKILRSQS